MIDTLLECALIFLCVLQPSNEGLYRLFGERNSIECVLLILRPTLYRYRLANLSPQCLYATWPLLKQNSKDLFLEVFKQELNVAYRAMENRESVAKKV
ncbi:hypothetical protein CBM2586_A10251 [Cupriavidus phytorum]|uniref:Uncharacterized protein n=1 Tax=Cupriavidus taiwanensis TaxID=164546 RepID=A0A375B9E6_9BURK|nr:hypothetical protein CBM2586_A10251 [Cupriavidus taiwanensis]